MQKVKLELMDFLKSALLSTYLHSQSDKLGNTSATLFVLTELSGDQCSPSGRNFEFQQIKARLNCAHVSINVLKSPLEILDTS